MAKPTVYLLESSDSESVDRHLRYPSNLRRVSPDGLLVVHMYATPASAVALLVASMGPSVVPICQQADFGISPGCNAHTEMRTTGQRSARESGRQVECPDRVADNATALRAGSDIPKSAYSKIVRFSFLGNECTALGAGTSHRLRGSSEGQRAALLGAHRAAGPGRAWRCPL
jgi:hypothetical protein